MADDGGETPKKGGCCSKSPKKKEDMMATGKRSCTDVACCLFFLLFVGGLVAVAYLGLSSGDVSQLRYDADYLGNRCGVGEYANATKAFYPRIGKDLVEQRALVYAGAFWKLKFYALCVNACPESFDIEDPAFVHDYGFDPASETTKLLGDGTQEKWISAMPTIDVMNRCLPRDTSSESSRTLCAYPKCTATAAGGALEAFPEVTCDESFGRGAWVMCPEGSDVAPEGSARCEQQQAACEVKVTKKDGETYALGGSSEMADMMMNQLAATVQDVYEVVRSLSDGILFIIVGGVLLPVAASFIFILFLRFFAKTAVWCMFILLVIAMVLGTALLYAKSGMELGGYSAQDLLDMGQNATVAAGNSSSFQGANSQAAINGTLAVFADPTVNDMLAVSEENSTVFTVAFWVMVVLTALTLVLLVLWRTKIARAVAIVKETCRVFATLPSLMIFPFTTVIAEAAVCVWAILIAAFLVTAKPDSFVHSMQALNATLVWVTPHI